MNAKEIIRRHYQFIGSEGGKAGTGRAKARPAHLARKAAKARWAKTKQTDPVKLLRPKQKNRMAVSLRMPRNNRSSSNTRVVGTHKIMRLLAQKIKQAKRQTEQKARHV